MQPLGVCRFSSANGGTRGRKDRDAYHGPVRSSGRGLTLLATLFAGVQGGCGPGTISRCPKRPGSPDATGGPVRGNCRAGGERLPVWFMEPPYRAGGSIAPAAIPTPIPITFAAALSLVARQNPQVAFANEQVNEAFAQLQEHRCYGCRPLRRRRLHQP